MGQAQNWLTMMENKTLTFLSKTKYIAGLQCPKLLWVYYNAKQEIPEITESQQAIFDQGHLVNEFARRLFPGGSEVPGRTEFDRILKETQKLLPRRPILFEPAFQYKTAYARPDVLKPNKDGSWDIYEVKSSGGAKNIYYLDIAFQKYCYEGAGLKIRRSHIVHINTDYVRRGEIDPEALFTVVDVTKEIQGTAEEIEKNIARMLDIIDKRSRPEIKIGKQCSHPYECPLTDACWEHIPEDSVFILNRIRSDKAFGFINEGFIKATDVPQERLTTLTHQIVSKCHKEKKAHVDQKAIKGLLKQLEFPLYFIDFETVGAAVPLYEGSRPFQQVPFQFSLHVWDGWDKKPVHHAFLAEGRGDPRPEFLKKLRSLIGPKGTVLAYNVDFERRCLKESAEEYPEYQEWFKDVDSRFVDLMVPFRRFDYYDPKQMGRYSIKSVYPALTGGSYKEMEISDGGQASGEYERVTFTDGVSEKEKRRIYDGLLEYCKLDTQAMIDILKVLQKSTC
jgi:polyhydroxyalkanoate synthesis regulator phasin